MNANAHDTVHCLLEKSFSMVNNNRHFWVNEILFEYISWVVELKDLVARKNSEDTFLDATLQDILWLILF